MKNENRGLWRAKRVGNGVWAKGYYFKFKTANKSMSCIVSPPPLTAFQNSEVHQVVSSTLGECVGLPDKNDTLIFEGDIVKTLETDSNGKQRCFPVVQSHGAFWLYDELLDSKLDFLGSYEKEALEIIGNIHDNPELVKGADNENEVW